MGLSADRLDRFMISWLLLQGSTALGFGSRGRELSILLSLRTMRCKCLFISYLLAWAQADLLWEAQAD